MNSNGASGRQAVSLPDGGCVVFWHWWRYQGALEMTFFIKDLNHEVFIKFLLDKLELKDAGYLEGKIMQLYNDI